MNRSTLIWTILLVAGGLFLVIRTVSTGMGAVYVERVERVANDGETSIVQYRDAQPRFRDQEAVSFSPLRTFGVWCSGLLTLGILSFLYGDNVFYKIAESIFVGVSAAMVMVVGFWDQIVTNLMGNLAPDLMRATLLPGTNNDQNLTYLVPLVLSILMLWRLAPRGAWIARWPLAFFIGVTAGIRMLAFFESDFVAQIQSTIIPLVVLVDAQVDFWASVRNCVMVFGVLASLFYFFFSIEHAGPVYVVSRSGIFFLMITFGALFANTVMARIALLVQRLEFLFDDWLWLIDPLQRRVGM